jgi:hypothetical protein
VFVMTSDQHEDRTKGRRCGSRRSTKTRVRDFSIQASWLRMARQDEPIEQDTALIRSLSASSPPVKIGTTGGDDSVES